MVYVLSIQGNPLMPCKETKARKLLKSNKAKIINYNPFIIQLSFDCENQVQDCTLGIDAGSKHIGFAVTSNNGNVLYRSEVILRQDIKENMESRKRLRKSRRNRKTRYRKARFNNRKSKRKLPPSIQSRIDSHIRLTKDIIKILPIVKIRCEIGQFDTQAILNPNIEGEEYQNGIMKEYDSVKEYVKMRDNYTCHYAKLRPDIKCNNKLEVDHKLAKSKGGSNRPENLLCSCEAHNKAKGNMSYKEFTGKNPPKLINLKETAFMNVLKDYLIPKLRELRELNELIKVQYTFGLYTRRKRNEWELDKSHINDAVVITNIKPVIYNNNNIYYIRQVRKKKRSLHEEIARKGRKEKNITAKRNSKNTKQIENKGKVWCLWDKVRINNNNKTNQIGYISGFSGKMVYIQDIEGKYIQISSKYKQISVDKINLISRNNNWIIGHMI